MRAIDRWLEQHGLDKYVDVFVENDIDLDVLPELTDEMLTTLGVSLGDRLRLLKAAREDDSFAPVSGDESVRSSSVPSAGEAQRRQLTVMFCDIVGSTTLSERLDPEDLRDIIAAYQRAVTHAVRPLDGYVARYLGDGLLIYFGYPRAHEDDAERGVRAGLAILDAVDALGEPGGTPLQVRIGIATGLVVAGDIVGEGASEEHSVLGDTPNLAARLQAIAPPHSLIIAERTRRLVAGLFTVEALGEQSLKGISKPVTAYRVTGLGQAASRFELVASRDLTPLVGRDAEIQLQIECWSQARIGNGQTVLLSGQAGVGKSRSVKSLLDHLAMDQHAEIRLQCTAYDSSTALHPFIRQLERAARFSAGDSSEERLDKLEALVAGYPGVVEQVAHLFALLLAVPVCDRYPPLEMTSQQQKEATLSVWVNGLIQLADTKPVVVIFEDAHWADPTSLEALQQIVHRTKDERVLVVITFRPEFDPPWPGFDHVTSLTLGRLCRQQCIALVNHVTQSKSLPDTVLNQILEKSDGIPLYVEELTKAILESGQLTADSGGYSLTETRDSLAIPSTLQDSLMARLDRLGTAKEVAQMSAVIGREFSFRLLSAVAANRTDLREALDRLCESDLVFSHGGSPDALYTFKHALIRDAAYASILKSKRRALHARTAAILERSFPELAQSRPELLAHHFSASDQLTRAIDFWSSAGQRAMSRAAHREALEHVERGLSLLERLPEGQERTEKELQLQMIRGSALVMIKGWAANEPLQAYQRAHALSKKLGDPQRIFSSLWGIWMFYSSAASHRDALELVDELFSIAERVSDPDLELQACHAAWGTTTWMGKIGLTLEHVKRGLAIYDPVKHHDHALRFAGHDPGVCAKGHRALMLWYAGYPDQARRSAEEAIEDARSLAHRPSMPHALLLACYVHQLRGDVDRLRARVDELIAHDPLRALPGVSLAFKGWLRFRTGQREQGLAELRDALAKKQGRCLAGYLMSLLAETLIAVGAYAQAAWTCQDALGLVQQTGEQLWEAEIHRLLGDLALKAGCPDIDRAQAHFGDAIATARAQGARSMELRATTNLAGLWHSCGEANRARQLLIPVYDWFSEGFDTADLAAASTLAHALQ